MQLMLNVDSEWSYQAFELMVIPSKVFQNSTPCCSLAERDVSILEKL